MTTTFILEPGYPSVYGITKEHILTLIREITPRTLLEKCKSLGIEKLKPETSSYEEYCEHFLTRDKGFFFVNDSIRFYVGGGEQHRNTGEFIIKTICLLVLKKAIEREYMINFRAI